MTLVLDQLKGQYRYCLLRLLRLVVVEAAPPLLLGISHTV